VHATQPVLAKRWEALQRTRDLTLGAVVGTSGLVGKFVR
jgi:hypothetical protein